jgi:hypothetical protein
MEVSGQLHAPAALSPQKETPVPTGWAPELVVLVFYLALFLSGSI